MKQSLVSSWKQRLVCRSFITGSDSYQGSWSSWIKFLSVFRDTVATRATAHRLRQEADLASHFKVQQHVENKGSWTRSSSLSHTALQCTLAMQETERKVWSVPLHYIFSYLLRLVPFWSKSCIFLCACWERRTDFPAHPSTLKLGNTRNSTVFFQAFAVWM